MAGAPGREVLMARIRLTVVPSSTPILAPIVMLSPTFLVLFRRISSSWGVSLFAILEMVINEGSCSKENVGHKQATGLEKDRIIKQTIISTKEIKRMTIHST